MIRNFRTKRIPRNRRGAALVEAAICMPVLLLLIFGSMEVTDAIFLKHSLKSASYEAARVISASGTNSQQAINTANSVLASYGVRNSTVTVSPNVIPVTPQGTVITVTVQAPARTNRLFTSNFAGYSGRTLVASTTMTRQ
jgi:Flp pilus assembly protein TadG